MIEFDEDPRVTLEVANSVTGPWFPVTNAPLRYVVKAARDRGKFFRLREPSSP